MKKATREWVRKAEADRRAAERLADETDPLHDQVCFFCQQASEKFLKAIVEELGITIPKTHDLEKLLDLIVPTHALLRSLRRAMRALTEFAVTTRYPGANATKRQAAAAVRWADRVRTMARAILGLH